MVFLIFLILLFILLVSFIFRKYLRIVYRNVCINILEFNGYLFENLSGMKII